MQPRLDLLTLGVRDLEEARRFYVDGLGWEPALVVPGEVVFIQIGHGLLLGLFGRDDLEADAGGEPLASGPSAVSLAQIVGSEDEVVATLAGAERAGGRVLKPAERTDWGGFHGYFADPSGFRWEIAHNPGFRVDADGRVSIGPVEG